VAISYKTVTSARTWNLTNKNVCWRVLHTAIFVMCSWRRFATEPVHEATPVARDMVAGEPVRAGAQRGRWSAATPDTQQSPAAAQPAGRGAVWQQLGLWPAPRRQASTADHNRLLRENLPGKAWIELQLTSFVVFVSIFCLPPLYFYVFFARSNRVRVRSSIVRVSEYRGLENCRWNFTERCDPVVSSPTSYR
jgi:hypothetical protein